MKSWAWSAVKGIHLSCTVSLTESWFHSAALPLWDIKQAPDGERRWVMLDGSCSSTFMDMHPFSIQHFYHSLYMCSWFYTLKVQFYILHTFWIVLFAWKQKRCSLQMCLISIQPCFHFLCDLTVGSQVHLCTLCTHKN